MMQDARDLPEGATLHADLCIVGAGAAGIALALEFAGSGTQVLLLESGGTQPEPETQALYAGTVADARLHSPPDRYRQRRFGGSTTTWGGRCVPFDPIDFEAREYIAHSGWPFGFAALAPHYERANPLCEAGAFAYTAGAAFAAPLRPMLHGFHSNSFSTDTLERFSCPTDFGARYAHRLRAAANVRVLLHANVTALCLDPGGAVLEALTVRTLTGRTFTVRAAHVVLATGGLEVARLLLANRDVHRQGIGNDHDVVGRYYMCHLAGTIGRLSLRGPVAAAWHGYDVADGGASR
jgi:choline dehydrogenase-like flavoprotein